MQKKRGEEGQSKNKLKKPLCFLRLYLGSFSESEQLALKIFCEQLPE